jgi:hypothetical protein
VRPALVHMVLWQRVGMWYNLQESRT